MRAVLALSSMLLILVLLLHGIKADGPSRSTPLAVGDEALCVLVGSRGHMLPRAIGEVTLGGFEDAISVGDMLLKKDERLPGLCLALLAPGFELSSFEVYELATEASHAERMIDRVRAMPEGSMLVSSVVGNVHVPAARRAALDSLCAELGARVSPFRAKRASWALISVRQREGWVTLAEAYSEERAINLAFTLHRDLQLYREHPANFFFARAKGTQTLSLFESRTSNSFDAPNNRISKGAVLGGVKRNCFFLKSLASEQSGERAQLLWENISLGASPFFEAYIGLQREASPPMLCRLLVNGESAGSIELRAPAESAWQPWSVDLARWAGEEISLELEATLLGDEGYAVSMWGDAQLRWEVR